MKSLMQIHLIDNKELEMSWREKIGRAILNAIIALPVKIHSMRLGIPTSDLFFKFKTESKKNIETIQEDIEEIKTTP